jgi:hypothetical protein
MVWTGGVIAAGQRTWPWQSYVSHGAKRLSLALFYYRYFLTASYMAAIFREGTWGMMLWT